MREVFSIIRVLCDFWLYMHNVELNFAAAAAHVRGIAWPFIGPAICIHTVQAADCYVGLVCMIGLDAIIVHGCL